MLGIRFRESVAQPIVFYASVVALYGPVLYNAISPVATLVGSSGMEPALRAGDFVFHERVAAEELRRDDIVVFRDERGVQVSRTIAVPGSRVVISNHAIYVDDRVVARSNEYAWAPDEFVVPEGYILARGDQWQRQAATAPIHTTALVGRVGRTLRYEDFRPAERAAVFASSAFFVALLALPYAHHRVSPRRSRARKVLFAAHVTGCAVFFALFAAAFLMDSLGIVESAKSYLLYPLVLFGGSPGRALFALIMLAALGAMFMRSRRAVAATAA